MSNWPGGNDPHFPTGLTCSPNLIYIYIVAVVTEMVVVVVVGVMKLLCKGRIVVAVAVQAMAKGRTLL